MINGVSSATQAQPVAPTAHKPAPKPPQPKPQSAAPTDTVQLSQAAQAALAALKEARETPAQTVQEAGQGDLQAQRLLAQEAADKSGYK